jgi:WS/DGAT/MGAT family acyltransferase
MSSTETWGEAKQMSPFESLMLRSEVNPLLRSTGVLFELLEAPPQRERVIAAHEWATRLLTRLRQRVVEDPLGLASPRWVVDRDFDLSYHLKFIRLPDPGSMQQVLDVAQTLAMAPFDRARPLWEAVLVEGLDDGGAAYLLKLHHSITDGQGTVQMLDILHSDQSEPGRAEHLPLPEPERLSGTDLALQTLRHLPGAVLRGAVQAGEWVATTAERVAADPEKLREGVAYALSLGRMLGPAPASSSILLEQRNLGRRLGIIELPLDQLRAGAKTAGGSVNDGFLAGLTGGIRRYHAHHGLEIDEVTLALPISVRKNDDPLGSNRFAGARIAAPVSVHDPQDRIRLIGARTRSARDEPALDFMSTLAPALSRLPATAVAAMTERVTRSIDIQASNVRGLERPAYLAGARVLRTYPFGAAPGPAVMVTLMSFEGTCCIGVTVNAAAVPDHEVLVRCLEEGLTEIAELA